MGFGNSLIIFDTIIRQAKQFDNMIESLILSISTVDQLSLDMCGYTIIRIVSDIKEPPLDRDANPETWLKNLAQFSAMFFQKYCNTDMIGLLTYLLNRMRFDRDYNQ